MVERQDHFPFWLDAMDEGMLEPARTRHELSGYMSGVDFPVAGWYKELMEIFPEAKVVLTVRDPKKWYKSVCFILQNMITLSYNWPYSWFVCLAGSRSLCKYEQKISGGIEPGKGELPPGIPGRMNEAIRKGEQTAVDFFKSHRDEVCSHVHSSQLLVFDVQEGWEPLCKFLDVPVPDTPFPNINKTAEASIQHCEDSSLAGNIRSVCPSALHCALLPRLHPPATGTGIGLGGLVGGRQDHDDGMQKTAQ